MAHADAIEWRREPGLLAYPDALAAMEARATAIADGTARERVWLVEHPPLYTAGTSADPAELIAPDRFPVYRAGRGGRYTYHGPGQRVGYLMLDLARRGRDVRRFVHGVERWVTLHGFSVNIAPDLGHFGGIVPCGLPDYPVTSLADLGKVADVKQFDAALQSGFESFLSGLGSARCAS